MPKISKRHIYNLDKTISPDDSWVGTDAQDFNKTKTFLAGDFLGWIMENYGGTEQNNFVTEKALGVIDPTVTDALVDAINGLDAFTVSANEIVVFTGDYSRVNSYLTTKFVYVLQTGKGSYGTGGTAIAIGDLVLLNPKQPETTRNSVIIEAMLQEDKIYSGHIVWREGTFTFDSFNFIFVIDGQVFDPNPKVHTLSDADATHGRIDIFVASLVTGEIEVVEGTPSATPQEPQIEYGTQLFVTSVFVPSVASGDTDPQIDEGTDFTIDLISNETDAEPDEWDLTNTPTDTNTTDTTPPLATDTKYITVGEDADGELEWTKASNVTYAANGYLKFDIKLSQPLVNGTISGDGYGGEGSVVRMKLTGTGHSSLYYGTAGNFEYFGLDLDSTDWQSLSVPMSYFNYIINGQPAEFNKFSFEFIRCGEISIDNVRINVGVSTNSAATIEKTSDIPVNDGATGVSPYAEIRDLPIAKRITASVTGSYDFDHSAASDWKITMTGNTTFTDSNLPTGDNTIEFTIKMTGNFTPTFPAYWDVVGDVYEGTVWNFYAVQVHNGTASSEEVTAFRTNMS